MTYNFKEIVDDLYKYLRLPETPVGIKYFESKEECLSVERVRVTDKKITLCQALWQSVTNSWTVAFTSDTPPFNYCAQANGLAKRDEKFESGELFVGGWFNEVEDGKNDDIELEQLDKIYEGVVISPLAAGKIEPDVCILHMNSAQAFLFYAGYLNQGYEKLHRTFGSETACNNSWVRAMATKKPQLALPSFGERKFGAAKDYELVCALIPEQLEIETNGVKQL